MRSPVARVLLELSGFAGPHKGPCDFPVLNRENSPLLISEQSSQSHHQYLSTQPCQWADPKLWLYQTILRSRKVPKTGEDFTRKRGSVGSILKAECSAANERKVLKPAGLPPGPVCSVLSIMGRGVSGGRQQLTAQIFLPRVKRREIFVKNILPFSFFCFKEFHLWKSLHLLCCESCHKTPSFYYQWGSREVNGGNFVLSLL